MLLGLASTANVTASGTTITENGRTTIVLPDLVITGRVPASSGKPAVVAVAKPWYETLFGNLDDKIYGVPRKTLLVIGGLGVLGWALSYLGISRSTRRYTTRRNPRRALYARNPRRRMSWGDSSDPDVQSAINFRRDFHWGYPAKSVNRRRISNTPQVLVELGTVKAITYQTKKKGERARYFVHDFEKTKPILGMDIKNKRLHFVGGSYTVTDDGITG